MTRMRIGLSDRGWGAGHSRAESAHSHTPHTHTHRTSLVLVAAVRLKRWRLDLCPLLHWWLPFYSDTLTVSFFLRLHAVPSRQLFGVSYRSLFLFYRKCENDIHFLRRLDGVVAGEITFPLLLLCVELGLWTWFRGKQLYLLLLFSLFSFVLFQRITTAMVMVSYLQLFWWYRHNIIYILFVDFLVILFLITTLPPLLFLFLCGVGSTFASIGWFCYWRSTRPDISSRRTVRLNNLLHFIIESMIIGQTN